MSHRSDERSRVGRESGFTLTELMMVIAMFVPILYAVVSAPSMIGGSLLANRSEASVGIKCRMQSERLATLIRPACISSLRVRSGGIWVPPDEGTWYTSLRYQGVLGLQTATATPRSSASTLEFVLAPGEVAGGQNGIDNDRDGVADNGYVRLTAGSGAVAALVGRVDLFRVQRVGRRLNLELGIAERDGNGRIHRRTSRIHVLLENN